MKHPVYLCLSAYLLICSCIIQTQTACPHPDVPENGHYTPKQSRFEPGDDITYSCKKGFALSGKERRICKTNGMWSDHSPFCDHATRLENPSVEDVKAMLPLVARVIDDNINTCFEWLNPQGKHMYVHLEKKIIVKTMMMYLKKGSTKIQIFTGLNNYMILSANYSNYLDTDQWIVIKCRNDALADTIKILATENYTLTVCEIEVYGKTEDGCDHSPNHKIPNGFFEVSRSKAVLVCEDGFRSAKSNRLVCEGSNTWVGRRLKCDEILCDPISSKGQPEVQWTFLDTTQKLSVGTKSQMKCSAGYEKKGGPDTILCQKNGTWTKTNATCVEEVDSKQKVRGIILGGVAIVVVLIIIALLAAIIYFVRKQKNKEVVVVFRPQSDEGVVPGSEGQYSRPRYESLKSNAPEPPSSPRPMAKLSTMSRGGDISSTKWKGTLIKDRTNATDGTFGAMKSSTIYGN